VKNLQKNKESLHITEYLSFSGIKDWEFCPHYYKLTRIDKVYKFDGNMHTAFGSAVHSALETLVSERNNKDRAYAVDVSKKQFLTAFNNDVERLNLDPESKDIKNMYSQADILLGGVLDFMKSRFGNYEVVAIEEELNEGIDSEKYGDIKYKGYIDLVIRTKDGKIHIIDWKTCSWGWPWKKKTDPMTTYQLTYYKNFFAKKYGFDLKNIETCFILLKRTAKKDNIEAIRISSGEKKTGNALRLLETAIHNIDRGNHIKKKTSCHKCDLWKTLCEG
jgi:exosome complex RNA-binding protein Csl4